MRMIALIARHSLTYDHRALGAGERFEATPIDAAILTYRRDATFAPRGVPTVSPAPVVPPDPEPAIVCEPAADEAESEPDPEPEPEKPKRRYRRRDLQAEEE